MLIYLRNFIEKLNDNMELRRTYMNILIRIHIYFNLARQTGVMHTL